MARLFFGVPLSKELKDALSVQLPELPGKAVPFKNWHITVLFLGQVDSEVQQKLVDVLQAGIEVPAFESELTGLGGFPDLQHTRVLTSEVRMDPGWTKLHEVCESWARRFEIELQDQKFVPHVTLSKMKKKAENCVSIVERIGLSPLSFSVTDLVLYESHLSSEGARYTQVAKATLL